VVDQLVREAFFRALEPAQLEVSVDMLKKLEESSRAAERQRELSLERCRYEVEKAQRQYDQVEPENRLVARTLERRWEERLKEQKCAEAELARWKRERNQVWSAGEILELQELIRDVPALWQAETSTNEDRKELLRLLIEEVRVWTGREKREVEVRIHWKGGSQTVHRARRSTGGHQLSEAAISRIRELAALGLSDRSIASELNAEGLRRSDGRNFVGHNVTHIRADYHIEQSSPPREPDIYNLKEAAALLGLSSQGLSDWLKDDDFEAERVQGGKEWKIRLTEKDIARLKRRWSSENEWTISQVAKFLGCTKQKVYRWIKNGKFRARRMIIGRRERWLISVEQVKDLKP